MKKLILALIAASCTFAFADTTVVETSKTTTTDHTFDQTKMKCKTTTLKDGTNAKVVKKQCKIQPKEAGDDKQTVRFIDENSGKKVKCEVDKHGNLVLAQCMSMD